MEQVEKEGRKVQCSFDANKCEILYSYGMLCRGVVVSCSSRELSRDRMLEKERKLRT